MKTLAMIGLVASLAGAAAGADYFGAGGAFPDGGGPGNPLTSDIVVGDTGGIVDVSLTLNGAVHSFVGDLIVTLTHVESNTSVVVVDRPGVPEFSGFGWAYNLAGDYTFSNAGTVTWDDVNGGVQDTGFNIASGVYASENSLTAFNGLDSAGTWRLTVSDNAAFDTGSMAGWTLSITVPTPATAGLFGVAGLAALRRRR